MRKSVFVTLCATALVATAFAASAFAQAASRHAAPNVPPAPPVGQPAPDFTLKDTAGRQHALKDYRGRLIVIGFIAVRCPVSNAYNTRIRELADEYRPRGVVFLGVNSNANEPVAEIKAHAAEHGFGFTILKDDDNRVADRYGAARTPEMYLVDEQGVLRYHGRVDNSIEPRQVKTRDLSAALDEVLAGKPVTTPETKAFGCIIVRAKQPNAAANATLAGRAKADDEPQVKLLKPAEFKTLTQASAGKVLVVNFWATWCGPCVAEFPEFVALDKQYRDKGVRFIAISADEKDDIKGKVIPFLKEQKATFEAFLQDVEDPQEMIDVVTKDWQGALPATFIYDKTGRLSYAHYGVIDRAELVKEIEKALK